MNQSNELQAIIQQSFKVSNPRGLEGVISTLLGRALKLSEEGKMSPAMSVIKPLLEFGFMDITPTGAENINIYSQSFREKLEMLEKLKNATYKAD